MPRAGSSATWNVSRGESDSKYRRSSSTVQARSMAEWIRSAATAASTAVMPAASAGRARLILKEGSTGAFAPTLRKYRSISRWRCYIYRTCFDGYTEARMVTNSSGAMAIAFVLLATHATAQLPEPRMIMVEGHPMRVRTAGLDRSEPKATLVFEVALGDRL